MNPRYEMPDNLYFGGGGETYYTPLALLILICSILLIWILPRRYVIIPLLVAGLWIPVSVNFLLAGFHFNALRILLLVSWIRLLTRGEAKLRYINSLDKILLCWSLYSALIFCLLWGWAAVANRLGFVYTTLGSYFLLRFLIRDKADILRVIETLAVALVLLTPFVLWEHLTGYNLLAILGAKGVSGARSGEIRAQGPFLHSIICGTLGAMLLPVFLALWWQGREARIIAVLGVFASVILTIVSFSSTPLVTFAAGLAGFLLWPARRHLRWFRWGLVTALVGLALVMEAPVWFLIAHLGAVTGGSGWHRAALIDMFVRHFGDWWLYGTRNNADWGYYMWDVDNAFVNNGVQGGLLTFALFIGIFVFGFRMIGSAKKRAGNSTSDARLTWGIGCALFANTVAFFGIFYFDQSVLAWYGLLATVSATEALSKMCSPKQVPRTKTLVNSCVLSTVALDSKVPTSAFHI